MKYIVRVRVLLAITLTVSVVGCAFIPAYTAPSEFKTPSYVPASTWLFAQATLRPSLSQLANATLLANAFTSQPGWDAYVRALTPTGPGTTPQDVLGLLDGEIAVATFGALDASSDVPHFVVLAHSSDPDKLVNVILQPDSEELGTPVLPPPTKDAHGANLYRSPLTGGMATFRGWLVLTATQQDLNDTLDRISGTTTSGSLNDAPRFKNLVSRLPSDRLGLEFIDTGALVRAVAPELPADTAGVPADTQALLTNIDSQAAISFAAASKGLDIRVEGATRLPPDTPGDLTATAAQLGDPGDAFNHLPADTLAAFGTGLPPLSSDVDDALNAELQQAADEFDAPQLAGLQLHPSQWLAGPVAFGASASNPDESDQPNVFLAAQVSDTAAARADLANLSSVFPPKTVTRVQIAGNRFFRAPIGDTGDQSLTYGLADDWLYAVSGDAEAVVAAADSGGLSQNPRFNALQTTLGSDTTNVFVDIQGIREMASDMLEPDERASYAAEVRPLINPLTFFGGGATSDPNGDVHAHFLLGIGAPE